MSNLSLNIVIPTYNAEATLPLLTAEIFSVLPEDRVAIFFVDDASRDNTREVIRQLACRYDSIYYRFSETNRGQQASLKIGLEMIPEECDYVITMDDDLQNPVSLIPELLQQIQTGYDMVYAVPEKKAEGIQAQPTLYRRIGSRFRDLLFESFLNKPAGVQVSSFRIMTRDLAKKVSASEKKFFYLSAEALQHKIRVGNIFYSYIPRQSGKSSYDLFKLVALYLNIIYSYKLKK